MMPGCCVDDGSVRRRVLPAASSGGAPRSCVCVWMTVAPASMHASASLACSSGVIGTSGVAGARRNAVQRGFDDNGRFSHRIGPLRSSAGRGASPRASRPNARRSCRHRCARSPRVDGDASGPRRERRGTSPLCTAVTRAWFTTRSPSATSAIRSADDVRERSGPIPRLHLFPRVRRGRHRGRASSTARGRSTRPRPRHRRCSAPSMNRCTSALFSSGVPMGRSFSCLEERGLPPQAAGRRATDGR